MTQPHTFFREQFIPQRLPDLVARYAVLTAIKGPAATDNVIKAKTVSLLAAWRERLLDLRTVGWFQTEAELRQYTYCYNCFPTFVAFEPQTRCCRMSRYCPWCYARQVQSIYKRVDAAWPDSYDRKPKRPPASASEGPGRGLIFDEGLPELDTEYSRYSPPKAERTFPYQLVELVRTVPAEAGNENTIWTLLDRLPQTLGTRWVTPVAPAGAVTTITVEPKLGGGVELHMRALYMADHDIEIPEAITPFVRRQVSEPTRMDIMRAVSRVCLYPRNLFHADVASVVPVLDQLRGKRLVQTYGLFRGVASA